MFGIDRWLEPAQPEFLKKYSRHPEAEEAVVLWNYSHGHSDMEEKHV